MSTTSAFMPPRRPTNPAIPPPTTPAPPTSLAGTMQGMNVSMPPPVPVQGMPGVEIPQDYANTLNAGIFEPAQTELPGRGHQALDMILASLGGLLGGQGLGGVANGILGVRQEIEQTKAENQQAREKARMDKINFIIKGMEATRADKVQAGERALQLAKDEGDRNAIKAAEAQLAVDRTKLSADQAKADAENALAAAEIERAKQDLASKKNPDREDALQTLEDYSGNLNLMTARLRASLTRGDAQPILVVPGQMEGEELTLQGPQVKQYLDNQLELAVNHFASVAEDPEQLQRLEDAVRSAYESTVLPALNEWTARNAIRMKKEATAAQAEAQRLKGRNEKIKRRQERVTSLFNPRSQDLRQYVETRGGTRPNPEAGK